MNNFENFYNRIRDAKNAYDAARTEDEKNAARSAYKAVWDELKELGNAACRLFNEYEVSRDSGNDYLDISEVVWDNEAAKLIEAMRQNGIERFTFSSDGVTQWKPHGFSRRPDAPLRDWLRSTAVTPGGTATNTKKPTATFSELRVKNEQN